MGNVVGSSDITVTVKTGNRKGAGTNAWVWMIAYDTEGNCSEEIRLSHILESEFERGKKDVFEINRRRFSDLTSPVETIEIWRDYPGVESSWFVDIIILSDTDSHTSNVFPIYRWIRPSYRYSFREFDTSLPQDDIHGAQREEELDEARRMYKLSTSGAQGMPIQVAHLPVDEEFLEDFQRPNITEKVKILSRQLKPNTWQSIHDISDIYYSEQFCIPKCQLFWQEDWCFGYQRLNGVNPNLIKLCLAMPRKFNVSDTRVKPFLEGMTLRAAMKAKRVYLCDLGILQHIESSENSPTVCAPFALFFVDKKNTLVPISIQLFQEPSETNPVFVPSDDHYTWQLVKMWFNNADANYHMAVTYLGWNCMMMESVAVSLHRHLSVSHPIYKLLTPFFKNMMAANSDITRNLMSEGGLIDRTTAIGVSGVKKLIQKSCETWRLNINSCLPQDLRKREVFEENDLPGYHYRDDGMLIYYAIQNYIIKYITLYYDDSQKRLETDVELQGWLKEMASSRGNDGVGLEGLPGFRRQSSTVDKIEELISSIINTTPKQEETVNGHLNKPEQLQVLLSSIIFTCSVQQAAVCSPVYDTYGFPPNYPLKLSGKPPSDLSQRDECDILAALETGGSWLETVALSRVLAEPVNKGTLGRMDAVYLHDPPAVEIHEKFKAELDEISKVIRDRNSTRDHSYHYLIPSDI